MAMTTLEQLKDNWFYVMDLSVPFKQQVLTLEKALCLASPIPIGTIGLAEAYHQRQRPCNISFNHFNVSGFSWGGSSEDHIEEAKEDGMNIVTWADLRRMSKGGTYDIRKELAA